MFGVREKRRIQQRRLRKGSRGGQVSVWRRECVEERVCVRGMECFKELPLKELC